jgi:coenzyme F420 hydrogenase subunit delta
MHNRKQRKITVYGCGNMLLGDDGFGPAVIAELEQSNHMSTSVHLEDVGTGIREFLFDYILDTNLAPDHLIILDAVDFAERKPGEVFTITPDAIPAKKIHDFSLHQFPTVNLLQELSQYAGINVHILAAQIKHIPNEIAPGLSPEMQQAVKLASTQVMEITNALCSTKSKEDVL